MSRFILCECVVSRSGWLRGSTLKSHGYRLICDGELAEQRANKMKLWHKKGTTRTSMWMNMDDSERSYLLVKKTLL